MIDPTFSKRALERKPLGGHAIIGGENYGQGSSREHAALAPRFLGLRVVIARSFARIHRQNLINYGILPLVFDDPHTYQALEVGDVLLLTGLHKGLKENNRLEVRIPEKQLSFPVSLNLTCRHIDIVLAGGLTNLVQVEV